MALAGKDIGIRKSEYEAKTHFFVFAFEIALSKISEYFGQNI